MSNLNKLTKSSSDCVVAGVCGGIAEYTKIPSWIIRIVFICSVLYFGMGLLPYALCWLLMPDDPNE